MRAPLLLVFAGVLGSSIWLLRPPASPERPQVEAPEQVSPAVPQELGPSPVDRPAAERVAAPLGRAEQRAAILIHEKSPLTAGEARLVVQVVAGETGAPVPGARVTLHESACGGGTWTLVEGSMASAENEAPLGDSEGRVEFPVRAGIEYCASVDMDDESAGRGELQVGAIGAGEYREVEIAIPTLFDQRVYARVFDGEASEPIIGAHVRLHTHHLWSSSDGQVTDKGKALGETVTDSEGYFHALVPSWRETVAYVSSPGWSLAIVPLVAGHDTAAGAIPVPLRPGSTLAVHVLDGSGDRPGLAVRVTMDSFDLISAEGPDDLLDVPDTPEITLEAITDPDGRAFLGEIPSSTPFEIEVISTGARVFRTRDDLRLEPRERREFEIDLTAGTEIVGTLFDAADGSPLAGQEIWLCAAEFPEPTTLDCYEGPSAYARTTTDSAGGFRFGNVPLGDWWLGPAASRSPYDREHRDALVPLAEYIQIPEGMTTMAVDLQTHRGIYLHGKVVDALGRPAENVHVSAFAGGRHGCWTISNAGGFFSVGPLIPAIYEVRAGGVRGDADSVPELVDSTTGEELILQLRRGARIAGHLLSRGEPAIRNATIDLISRSGPHAGYGDCTMCLYDDEDASFEFDGLLPGSYDLLVSADRNEFAISCGLVVEAGEDLEGVELVLQPGDRLELSLAGGEEWVEVQVFERGELVSIGWVGRDEPTSIVVPPGSLTLRVLDQEDELLAEQVITAGVGESRLMTVPWTVHAHRLVAPPAGRVTPPTASTRSTRSRPSGASSPGR